MQALTLEEVAQVIQDLKLLRRQYNTNVQAGVLNLTDDENRMFSARLDLEIERWVRKLPA